MDAFVDRILGIPDSVKWTLAIVSAAIGLLFILRTDWTVARIRRWLIIQLKWVRSPRYRRLIKLYGWLLFVLAALLSLLLAIGVR